jgi:hypothetical protein
MSEFIDPEQEARKDTRRAWKVMLAALILVFGLFAGLMLFYDCPPPDDSSIMPKFTESPGGYNPLAVLFEELNAMPLKVISKQISIEAMGGEKGTEEEVRGFLIKQEAALQVFEKFIQTDPLTWRWPGGEQRVSFDLRGVDYSSCQSIWRILLMKAHLEAMDGKMEASVRTCLQLVKYGYGLEGAEGTMLENLFAISASAGGRTALDRALVSEEAQPELLANVQQAVALHEPRRENFVMNTKVESLYTKNMVAAVKKNPELIFSKNEFGNLKVLFIKPNLTQAMAIHFKKPVIDGLTVSWREGWMAAQQMEREYEAFKEDRFRFWISPNAFGNRVMQSAAPAYQKICEKNLINACMTRQVIIILALRRYELAQGRLPENLEDLVPKYLAAVPVDPFTESPMLWNPEKKVIYSVGTDGKDDGGRINARDATKWQTFNTNPDVSIIYWWSEEAERVRVGKAEEEAINRELLVQQADERAKRKPKISKSKTILKLPTGVDQKK